MFVRLSIVSLLCLLLVACGPKPRGDNEIIIATISGPETELMEIAKTVALKEHNLKLVIKTFEDYVMPNMALSEGAIDANMFQHQPYLDALLAKKPFPLVAIGKVFIYPMGIYSQKYNTLEALPKGSIIAIPNDPSNGARALRLLAKAKLIDFKDAKDLDLSIKKITDNPNQYRFKEIPAAQLPRILADVDMAVINANYAKPTKLAPIFLESKDSPYANVVVIRAEDKDQEKYQKLIEALHSEEIIKKAKALFGEHAIKAW